MFRQGRYSLMWDKSQTARERVFTFISCIIFLFFYSAKAFAVADDPGSFGSISSNLGAFQGNVATLVANLLADPSLNNMVDMMFKAFAAITIINLFVRWQFGAGVTMADMFSTVVLIGIVRVFMVGFDSLTTAAWGWSEGVAAGIQKVAIGNTDLLFMPQFMYDVIGAISWESISWFDGIAAVVGLIVIYLASFFLTILAVIASSWALWGYVLAKVIGWLFIPFVLFERLAFLFDGWLRLFVGFLIYNIIARVNLVLVTILLQSFFNLPSPALGVSDKFFFTISHFTDILALLALLAIAILSLLSTGSFAKEIAGGVGGVGSSVRTAAMGLGKIATKGM